MKSWAKDIPRISVEDYLQSEQASEIRHEYLAGEIYAMVGATDRHGLLVLNLAAALHRHLRGGPCQVFASDMKVQLFVGEETYFYYPDILVSCRPDDRERLFRQHPCVLVEVLSDATERIDRREKFLAYQRIEALREYVLVAQEPRRVTVYRREQGDWKTEILEPGETLTLRSLDFAMTLAELYEGVS